MCRWRELKELYLTHSIDHVLWFFFHLSNVKSNWNNHVRWKCAMQCLFVVFLHTPNSGSIFQCLFVLWKHNWFASNKSMIQWNFNSKSKLNIRYFMEIFLFSCKLAACKISTWTVLPTKIDNEYSWNCFIKKIIVELNCVYSDRHFYDSKNIPNAQKPTKYMKTNAKCLCLLLISGEKNAGRHHGGEICPNQNGRACDEYTLGYSGCIEAIWREWRENWSKIS